jgi:hypothetical protein
VTSGIVGAGARKNTAALARSFLRTRTIRTMHERGGTLGAEHPVERSRRKTVPHKLICWTLRLRVECPAALARAGIQYRSLHGSTPSHRKHGNLNLNLISVILRTISMAMPVLETGLFTVFSRETDLSPQ